MISRFLVILFGFALFSCKEEHSKIKVSSDNMITKIEVDSSMIFQEQFKDLIQKSLFVPIVEESFEHFNEDDVDKFRIVRNDSLRINKELHLTKFNKLVKFSSKNYAIANNDSLYYINFSKIKITDKSAIVSFYYNYENYETESHFKKNKDGKWEEAYTLLHQY
jgi:hypothetical protein